MPEQTISTVRFHGTEIIGIAGDSPATTQIVMKAVVEGMGMDWPSQLRKIRQNQILSEGLRHVYIPSNGGIQETITLPLSLLNGWLVNIQPTRIPDYKIRMKVFAYQREAYDVLFHHFCGKALGIPAASEAIEARFQKIEARLDALEAGMTQLVDAVTKIAESMNGFVQHQLLERKMHQPVMIEHREGERRRKMKTMRSIMLGLDVLPVSKHDSVYKQCSEACAKWLDLSDANHDAYEKRGGIAARVFDEQIAARWFHEHGRKIVRAHRRVVKKQMVMKFPKLKVVEPAVPGQPIDPGTGS